MTIKPFPSALQKKEAPWKLDFTTSKIAPDQSLVQDEFIALVMTKNSEEDSTPSNNRFNPLNKHEIVFICLKDPISPIDDRFHLTEGG